MPPRAWMRLIAAAAFCASFGALAVAVTASMALRYRASNAALAFWPLNGEARGSLAGQMAIAGNVAEARSLAKQAVREVPGDAISLRALGLAEEAAGNEKIGRDVMGLATKASRRDLLTDLWFIEYYVSKNDISGAMRYYDYALRTSSNAEPLLFPLLASAMSDPEISRALEGKLTLRPVWFRSFLQYAFSAGDADEQLVPLTLRLAHDGQGLPRDLQKQYAQRLGERANFVGLANFASGLGSPLINGPASLDAMGGLPPADWHLSSGAGLSVYPSDGGGVSFSTVNKNVVLAERILKLPPGRYSLRQTVHFQPAAADTRVRWAITCAPSGFSVPVTVDPAGSQHGDIPKSGCPYQKFSIALESSDFSDEVDLSGTISKIRLYRQ